MRTYNITIHLKGNALRQLDKMFNGLQKTNREARELGNNLSRAGGKFQAIAQVGAGALRFAARLHAISYLAGPMALKKGADFLLSPQMNEGIRYLQRMHQARVGLGPQFAEAQKRALALSTGFGLDPSTVVSSMNVLTGMRVGSKNLTLAQAARITQFGGLIAQQSGIPADTVMLNLQQIMAMAVPNLRDIKQLLTHAPILGRYAMEEMQKRGITGKKTADFLQEDRGFLLASMERFLSENPALAATKARGIASMANLEFFARLAENPSWINVANQYAVLLGKLGEALAKLISSIASSPALQESIARFTILLEKLASTGISSIIDKMLDAVHELTGVGLSPEEERKAKIQAFAVTKTPELLEEMLRKNIGGQPLLKAGWVPPQGPGGITDVPVKAISDIPLSIQDVYKAKGWEFPATIEALKADILSRVPNLADYATVFTNFFPSELQTKYPYAYTVGAAQGRYPDLESVKEDPDVSPNSRSIYSQEALVLSAAPWVKKLWAAVAPVVDANPNIADIKLPIAGANKAQPQRTTTPFLGMEAEQLIRALMSAPAEQEARLTEFGTAATGDSISGFGQDRRALTINFNAPIVEWDSTIETDNPQEVVDTVSDTIEGAASRAIQIALLGATGTMSTRF